MPALSPERRTACARLGGLRKQRRPDDDPDVIAARDELRAAEAAEAGHRHGRIIGQLTPDRQDRLAVRAVDDPAQLAAAAHIVRVALQRQRIKLADLSPGTEAAAN